MRKIRYFLHMCFISPISCWNVSRLSRHTVRLMNERWSLHHSQSKVVFRNLFGLWQLKHSKIRITYKQWRSNFPRRRWKQKYGKKIASYVISNFGNGRVPERFLWSVSTKSLTKNFVCRKLRPLFVFVVFQRIFHLEPQRQRTLRFLFGDCRSFYFHLLVKLTFLVGKGPLCLYDKENNTWLFVHMNFLFSRSTWHFVSI